MGSPIIFSGNNAKLLKPNLDYFGGALTSTGTFAAANNQSSSANVTGLAFPNATIKASTTSIVVNINATVPLYEYFTLYSVQKASSWDISYTSVGDNSGFSFTITNAGQIQYQSPNSSGWVSTTVKYIATAI